jgi:hypothetical protein
MAVLVILVFRHAGNKTVFDVNGKQQFTQQNGMPAAVETRRNALCVFPELDRIEPFNWLLLIVMRNMIRDKLADRQRLFPGG